jgi:hypothetical protein
MTLCLLIQKPVNKVVNPHKDYNYHYVGGFPPPHIGDPDVIRRWRHIALQMLPTNGHYSDIGPSGVTLLAGLIPIKAVFNFRSGTTAHGDRVQRCSRTCIID